MVLRSLVFPTTLIVFVINVWLVLLVHAADDESVPTLLQRLLRGPDAWETSDRLLFVAMVLASFELLDYVSKHSGGRLDSLDLVPLARSQTSWQSGCRHP